MENEKSKNENPEKANISSLIIAVIVILILILSFIIISPHILHNVNRMSCGTNIAALGKAMLVYGNDFDQYPTSEKWCDLLMEKCQVKSKIFRCPGAKEGPCNYALNKYINEIGTTNNPDIVVFFETHPGWNQVGGPEILTTENHEREGCNIVFLDGHVKFVETKDIPKLKWKSD